MKMKNDLEKMRKEFEEKYALAKKENELEEKCNGYYFMVSEGGIYNKEAKYRISAMTTYTPLQGFPPITLKQVQEILINFPFTHGIKHDGNLYNYLIYSSRSFGDRYGEATIVWQSGEYEVSVSFSIDDDKDFLNEFFIVNRRETVDTENSTYANIQRFNNRGNYCRYYVSVYDFKKTQDRYYGGVRYLTDRGEIERLINYIKEL